jgi:UDP-N-acetylglucosamine 4,6-dehydratase
MRERFKDDNRLRFFIGDVRDRWRLSRAFESVDVVVHAAALKRIEVGFYNPDEMYDTNVQGARNVILAARDAEVKKVVALSTDKAFQPVSPYGLSKAMAEYLFLAARDAATTRGPRYALCRYGNVWGSTGSVGPLWSQQLEDGAEYLKITDPECTRFFMRMEHAVQLVVDTITEMPETIQIPQLPAYRLGDLATAMGARTVVTGLPAWEKLHESMDENNCSKDARRMTIDELKAVI